jgi:hypothetical protein
VQRGECEVTTGGAECTAEGVQVTAGGTDCTAEGVKFTAQADCRVQ